MTGRIRVVIADDQPLVRAGLRMILEVEPDIVLVGEAADGDEAVCLARSASPDVVLMDVRMPRLDGIAATRLLLDGRTPAPRVLMLTTFDLDEYVYEALRAGASGFVLKDLSPEQLVDAIRIVAGGEALLAPTVTRRMISEYVRHPPAQARQRPRALDDLTPREHEMLAYIAKGMSNAEIAAAAFVSEPTVKTHVARILMKLGLRDRVQVVVFAYEHGLAEPGGAEAAGPAAGV
jgi:DNA-binding NarL/FixJ family response regulator